MSIEWSVRLAEDVVLARVVARSNELSDELIATMPGEVTLVTKAWRGFDSAIATDDVPLTDGFGCLLGLIEGINIASLQVIDAGYPQEQEGGVWLFCTLLTREPAAFVMTVCTAVAAAELTGADVVDEAGYLGGRTVAPAEVLAFMRGVEMSNAGSLAARAERIYRKMSVVRGEGRS